MKHMNLIGQKFGKLLVLEDLGKTGPQKKEYYWKCQCDCGNIVNVAGNSLRSGNTKSCGCLVKETGLNKWNLEQSEKAKILPGTKFGKLTVIEDIGFKEQVPGHNRRWYKCKCDCGNIKEIQGNMLKQGQTISCGTCNVSKGEFIIQSLLDKTNILYNKEVILPQLKQETQRNLRFDFVLYNNDGNIQRIIEFDGRQHFYGPDTKHWGHTTDTLETIQEKDNIKNNFCIKNNIPLIRIPFYHLQQLTLNDLLSDKYLVKGDDIIDE